MINNRGVKLTVGFFLLAFLLYMAFWPKERATQNANEMDVTWANKMDVTWVRMAELAEACKNYHRIVGAWPSNFVDLLAVVRIKDKNIFVDGWGNEISLLTHTSASNTMWLESYGADGSQGGFGSNADVVMRLP